ncbi:MAG: head-tail connector protein [Beijerinckiaceae bacterium]|nr:head-tail connector protein [Beijerinckiaceae bacterium]
MLAPVRTTPPEVSPVSLSEAKAHLRVDSTDENTLIQILIDAATAHLDGWGGILGRCLVNQVWKAADDDWEGEYLRLPFPNVSEVAVTYYDASNVLQTLSPSLYALLADESGSFLRFSETFSGPALYDDREDSVQITMTAGYGAACSDVPAAIRAAILLMVGDLYQNREAKVEASMIVNPTVDRLLSPYRRVGF